MQLLLKAILGILLPTLAIANSSFIRLLSGQVGISDASVVEFVSTLNSPIQNKYTIFGWVQFKGTESRLYNILKLRNLPQSSSETIVDSMNSILSISYSNNQIDGKQFVAVVYANGQKQTDSLAKIIEGPMLESGVWNFFAVTTDYDNLKSTIYVKIFDKEALEASYQITLSYKDFKMLQNYSVFLGKNNEPPNNNENFRGLFYNFYFFNNYVERPEILYLFDSSQSLDLFRGVNMNIPLFTTNSTVSTDGNYKSTIAWSNIDAPNVYSQEYRFSFKKNSSAKINNVKIDLSTRAISSLIVFMQFKFEEPILDEFVILRFGEIGQPNSVVISLVEEAKETSTKTFSQNLSVMASDSVTLASSYSYNPDLKMPKRMKIEIWSTNNKRVTFLSPNNYLNGTDYECSIGFTRYNENIMRVLFQEQKNYIISTEVKDFTMTTSLKELVVADNAGEFTGRFIPKQILYLDAPVKFSEALFSSGSSNIDSSCQYSISMIRDFGGCAQCASADKVINNFACGNFCMLPTKNFNGICQQCIGPNCDSTIPNFAFSLTKTGEGTFLLTATQPLFKSDGTPFKFDATTASQFKTSINGTSLNYTVDYTLLELNAGVQVSVSPASTMYDVTLIVEPLLDGKKFYTKEKNELVAGISKLQLDVIQTKDLSLDRTGQGISIFLLIIFFSSVVAAILYIMLVTSNNYMKWRLMHSVNYIHLLALLLFVNSQFPNLLNAFMINTHGVLIRWINGAFNDSIYESYKTNSEFNLFAQITGYTKFVSNGLTQHFILNFLLIIVFHLIAIFVYGVFKLLDFLLKNKGKTRVVAVVKKVVRAFEWNIAYYGFALFFVQIIFFAAWNYFRVHTGFHLVNASLALSIIYSLIFCGIIFLAVLIPTCQVEQLKDRQFRRKWGFLYTNFRQTFLRKHFDVIFHGRNFILLMFLVFAYNSPILQTVAMFLVSLIFFAAAWVALRPWKSWVMWVIELVPEACLCLTLMGYLILAADEQNKSFSSEGRASVGAFIISMNFIGILANAASIFFWFFFNWKYSFRVFKTYDQHPDMPELLFQSRELLALTAYKNGVSTFESHVMNAKFEQESSQRVHLNVHAPNQSHVDYPSVNHDHNISIDRQPRFSESVDIHKMSIRESEPIYRETKTEIKQSKFEMRVDNESVLTDEREPRQPRDTQNHPARKVLNNSSINDEDDSALNASDSIDMGHFKRPPPGQTDPNKLTQSRFRDEEKNYQNPQSLVRPSRPSQPIVIPQYNHRKQDDIRPMASDEDFS